MDEIGLLLLLTGVLGLGLSVFMIGRRQRRPGRSLPGNFDFIDRKNSENRR